ncbi:hypothetical protein [Streptomyces sp. SPB074]|uniref:hypothetical protein n=1 Tax=Streptomyces sp. (strain SPB074) TaxID=465543 RepID=UPI0001D1E298|nr:hypothetical protein [Streptomyces sp. SPB074]EFG64256.1 hypothetical protein SSBG_05036 [Streptomyces sp. SPB074]
MSTPHPGGHGAVEGRVCLDAWELADEVQAAVAAPWAAVTTETVAGLAAPPRTPDPPSPAVAVRDPAGGAL